MTAYVRAELDAALEALADSTLAATEFEVARAVVIAATLAGRTIATAESLTAGLIAATLATVPGSSRVLRGGYIAYASDLKASMLGVSPDVMERHGVISTPVVEAMARGALDGTRADFALACTGVAGPDEQDGHPVGEVHVAVASAGSVRTHQLTLSGTRDDIRHGTVLVVLGMVLDALLPLVDNAGVS